MRRENATLRTVAITFKSDIHAVQALFAAHLAGRTRTAAPPSLAGGVPPPAAPLPTLYLLVCTAWTYAVVVGHGLCL